jgi:hypothetical protein
VHIKITIAWENLVDKAQIEHEVIKFMNGKTQANLEILGVKDKTLIIMQEISVHSKQSLIMLVQIKCNEVKQFAQKFRNQF